MSVLLGLDIGTTGARAVAVDGDGHLVAEATAEYPLHSPRPGWTEQSPENWWQAAKDVLQKVVRESEDKVSGLGLTGQMHGSVFLDEKGEIIRPALLWNDQRTDRQCQAITEIVGKVRLGELAGNPALTGFQAPKILWLREEEPENYSRLSTVLLPKDYVRYRLTGEFATDVADASGTLLLDVGERNWSSEILDALEIPLEWMPRVYEGPESTGVVREEIAAELGLQGSILVAAGGGDNAAAAVGTGVVREGLVSSSVGTSGVIFAHTDKFRPDPAGRIHAFCHSVPWAYHLMGVTLSAGGSLDWWAREVLGDKDFAALAKTATEVPAGSEGLVFLPYLAGERTPHLDPAARGAFFGLTARHSRAHMTRALMEGVIFSMRDALESIWSLGAPVEQIRAIGGGARSPLWRQLQADIYSLPIHRTAVEEGPAYGAALLAGVATEVFVDVKEASSQVKLCKEVVEPNSESQKIYEQQFNVFSSLYPQTKEAMHELTNLEK